MSAIVFTTNLDAQRPVMWDMGRIAQAGTPEALRLFHDVLMASAAVPGIFPPVLIGVRADGRDWDEMHVDGGAVANFFLAGFLWGVRYFMLGRGLSMATLFLLISGTLTFLIGLLAFAIMIVVRRVNRRLPAVLRETSLIAMCIEAPVRGRLFRFARMTTPIQAAQ